MTRECYSASLSNNLQEETLMVNEEEVKAKKTSPTVELAKDLLELPLDNSAPNQKVWISILLELIRRKKMIKLLY